MTMRPSRKGTALHGRRLLDLRYFATGFLLYVNSVSADTYVATTDAGCQCYQTNGTSSEYFTHHRFFDFQNLPQYASSPALLTDASSNANAGPTSSYFTQSNWTSIWALQSWDNSDDMADRQASKSDATVLMVNSPNNVYIEKNEDSDQSGSTHLTLRTSRISNTLQTAAEINSVSSNFHYVSMRMYARTQGQAGAVTAMFTYRGSNAAENVQEADLEVRTVDPTTHVQFTNQPGWDAETDMIVRDATSNATIPQNGKWSDWAVWRVDWTPDYTYWYINGVLTTKLQLQVPKDPSALLFNTWSDGGSWSGNMSTGHAAYMQIRWIEMLFNNTDKAFGTASTSGACSAVCSIDATNTTGQPVLVVAGSGANAQTSQKASTLSSQSTLTRSTQSLSTVSLQHLSTTSSQKFSTTTSQRPSTLSSQTPSTLSSQKASSLPSVQPSTLLPQQPSTVALQGTSESPSSQKPSAIPSSQSRLTLTSQPKTTSAQKLSETTTMVTLTKTVSIVTTTTRSISSSSSSSSSSCLAPLFGQCGGKNWAGCRQCVAESECKSRGASYSQCVPSTRASSSNTGCKGNRQCRGEHWTG